ncbi:MAG TPA: triose-phosphate isomerase [Nevskiaceae bacterium]
MTAAKQDVVSRRRSGAGPYLVVGNWKMNGDRRRSAILAAELAGGWPEIDPAVTLVACPPSVYLQSVGSLLRGSGVALGAQDLCEQEKPGAFTGEVHGAMLKDLGCRYVVVGHSERRRLYGDDDERVAHKFATALACGLTPILCIGETADERDAGVTEAVLKRQLHAIIARCGARAFADAVLAYEPVWAIGTGRSAAPEQAQAVHAFLRGELRTANAKLADCAPILYGGSVKSDNAHALFSCADVDGGLIGGASLKAADFLAIADAARHR